jgi:hypothetical protein
MNSVQYGIFFSFPFRLRTYAGQINFSRYTSTPSPEKFDASIIPGFR